MKSRAQLFQALSAMIAIFAVVGCRETSRISPQPHPNVLLVSIDTLRADHLGTYGYPRDTSPNLDSFSQRSVVFERAYSTSYLDWQLLPLPSWLFWLYIPLRPFLWGYRKLFRK